MEVLNNDRYDPFSHYPEEILRCFYDEQEMRCLVCWNPKTGKGTDLQDFDEFLTHIRWSKDHYERIGQRFNLLSLKLKRPEKSRLVADPIEKEMLDEYIKSERHLKKLKYKRNANALLIRGLKLRVEKDWMTVVECLGAAGSGKSVSMLALANVIRMLWAKKLGYMPNIYVGFNHEETSRLAKDAKKGDVIIQDEDPKAFGGGAAASQASIENLLKIMRQQCVSYIFVSPVAVPYIENVNYRFETYGMDFNKRTNKLILYDRKNNGRGWVDIKLLSNEHPLMVEYLKKKIANIERIKDAGGKFSSKYTKQDIIEDTQRVLVFIDEMYDKEKQKALTDSHMKFLAKAVIDGTIEYQEGIGKEAYFVLQERLVDYHTTTGSGVWEKYFEATDNRILSLMYEKSVTMDQHQELGREWFNEYIINGLSGEAATDAINEKFGTSYTRPHLIQTCFNAFQENCIGTATELAIQELYFPNTEHKAGQSEPDLIGDGFIVEIKARYKLDRGVDAIVRDEGYLQEYYDNEYPTKAIIVDYDKKKARILGYDRVYNNIEG